MTIFLQFLLWTVYHFSSMKLLTQDLAFLVLVVKWHLSCFELHVIKRVLINFEMIYFVSTWSRAIPKNFTICQLHHSIDFIYFCINQDSYKFCCIRSTYSDLIKSLDLFVKYLRMIQHFPYKTHIQTRNVRPFMMET